MTMMLFVELSDDLIYNFTKFDIYQWDVTRVILGWTTYVMGIYFGKLRIGYLFVFLLYLVIGSNYTILPYTDMKIPIIICKFLALFMVATCSKSSIYHVSGPYGVGYKEFKLKTGNQPWVSWYYPIDKDFYEKHKTNSEYNVQRLRDGFKTAEGIATGFNVGPHFIFRYFTQERLYVINDHEIHKDFSTGSKNLIPAIFSHGLIVNRTNHSYICSEMVSHGCIVYAIDHTDGSCSYFLDTTKNPPVDKIYTEYNVGIHEFSQEVYRRKQILTRLDDVKQLLDYIKANELKELPSINMDKLISIGHSMGGMTALEACYKFKEDFKYCISLDPFFRARFEQIEVNDQFVTQQPLCMISTEYFHNRKQRFLENYDSMQILLKFFSDVEKFQKDKMHKNYNLIVKNIYHLNQYDMGMHDGKTLAYFGASTFSWDAAAKMKENNLLIIAFMNENQLLEVPCILKISEVHQDS